MKKPTVRPNHPTTIILAIFLIKMSFCEIEDKGSNNDRNFEMNLRGSVYEGSKLEDKSEDISIGKLTVESKFRELGQYYNYEYWKLYNNYYQAYLNWYNTYYLPYYSNKTDHRFPYNDQLYDMNDFLPPIYTKNDTDTNTSMVQNSYYNKPYMTQLTQSPPAGRLDVPYIFGHPVIFNAASSPYLPGLINPFVKSEKELQNENSQQSNS